MGLSEEILSSGVRTVKYQQNLVVVELLGYREGISMN
jgi:hypothetical protein